MRFKGFDLNLLVAFDALMTTHSVSRAAEHLNLSQPAVSAALSRLRDFFQDDLLVSVGKRMHPTAHADSLWPQIRRCLQESERLLAIQSGFDPATSQRSFRIAASDYITAILISPLVRLLAETAPAIQIEINAPDERSTIDLDDGKLDLIITPEVYVSPSHPFERIFAERHVIVCDSGNTAALANMDDDAFFAAEHVGVSIGRIGKGTYADSFLGTLGRRRNVQVVTASFTTVPWLLCGTNRLAVMHERLARLLAQTFPMAILPLPPALEVPPMHEVGQIHSARANDEGVQWILALMRRIAVEQYPDAATGEAA